jgi:hypothetical protein
VTPRRLVASALVSLLLVLVTAWHLDMSVANAALVAPLIVVVFGAAAFLVVLWAKIIRESIRRR